MNTLFAAGLFENPWVVVVIVLGGALVNWLSKRRAEKQADHQPDGEEPSAPASKPPGEFNLEDALRRLMGEEPPAQSPVPPPIPRAAQDELPPEPDWEEEEQFEPVRQTAPPLRPPPIVVAPTSVTIATISEQEAARRFEQFNEQGRHPATVVSHGREHLSRASKRAASRWRDPRSARQAFVASLVFGPPKSLEP